MRRLGQRPSRLRYGVQEVSTPRALEHRCNLVIAKPIEEPKRKHQIRVRPFYVGRISHLKSYTRGKLVHLSKTLRVLDRGRRNVDAKIRCRPAVHDFLAQQAGAATELQHVPTRQKRLEQLPHD